MISLYLDYLKSVKAIVEGAKRLSVNRLPLRNIDDINIYDYNDEQIKQIASSFKKNKIKISLLDINVTHDIYQPVEILKIASICKEFGCRNVVINMPLTNDLAKEKTQLQKVIKSLLEEAKKEKIKLIFHPNYEINSAYHAYLIKEIKDVSFSFNPGLCYEKHRSITTFYRLLKKRLEVVMLYDVNVDKVPALLGYGKALILDILDKLEKDKFKGQIFYDSNLEEYIERREKAHKRRFRFPFFRKKKLRQAHLEMDEQLRLKEEDKMDYVSLLSSQLRFLNHYKKN